MVTVAMRSTQERISPIFIEGEFIQRNRNTSGLILIQRLIDNDDTIHQYGRYDSHTLMI